MSNSTVQAWLKDSINIKLDKNSDISLLLRGPLRNILLSFLIPRCRSEDEVDVIRSNLYVHGLTKSEPLLNLNYNTNAELTRRLAELEHRKRIELNAAMPKNNTDNDDFDPTEEWNVPTDKKQLKKLNNIIGFLDGTTSDLKVLLETQNMVVLEQEEVLSPPEKLYQLQEEGIKLFHSIFFETTATPQDLEDLNQRLDYLCDHFVGRWDKNNKGLSQKQLVVWQKSEIKKAKDLMDKFKVKLAPKASPTFAEDLLSELYKNLCREHIDMYSRNEHQKSHIESIETSRLAKLSALTASGQYEGDISHPMKLIYEKQLKCQIKLHAESKAASEMTPQENNGAAGPEVKNYLGSQESEVRENLINCLLCNYPNKSTKLVSTICQAGRYSEFVQALRSPADRRSDNPEANRTTTTTNNNPETNRNFENMLHALNPNRETISTNFALRFASDK